MFMTEYHVSLPKNVSCLAYVRASIKARVRYIAKVHCIQYMEEGLARMWSILEDLFSRVNEDEEGGNALHKEFPAKQFQVYKSMDEYAAKLRN